jgi:hypothetical protein
MAAKTKPKPKPAAKPAAKPATKAAATKAAAKPKTKAKAKPPNPLSGGVPLRVDGSGIDGRVLGAIGSPFAISQGLNPNAIAAGANTTANTATGAQMRTQAPVADQLADQQWDQVKRVAGAFQDSRFFKGARNQLNDAFDTAGQMQNVGNQTISMGDAAGQNISNLAPLAQQQASFAANNIYGLAPQVMQIGDAAAANVNALAPQALNLADQYGGMLTQQAFDARRQGDAAAASLNALAPQAVNIGDRFMGQMSGLGSLLASQAQQGFATSGPSALEAELTRQAQDELSMGGRLTAEQTRDATQAARQGMAARGMATGNAAMGAELLNRDRFASQRAAERRAFAGSANQMVEGNMLNRRAAAGNLAAAGAGVLGDAGRMGLAGRELAGNLYDSGNRAAMSGMELGGRLLDNAGRMRTDARQTASNIYDTGNRAAMSGMELGGRLLGDAGQMQVNARQVAGNLYDTGGRLGMTGREMAGRLYDTGGRMNVLGTELAGNLMQSGADVSMRGRQIGGGLMGDSARLRQTGAGMLADLDPYKNAMNPGLSLGQTAMNASLNTVGQNYNNALELFGNAGSFNVNRADNFKNNYDNNLAAMTSGIWANDAARSAANAAKPKWWETALGATSNIIGNNRNK